MAPRRTRKLESINSDLRLPNDLFQELQVQTRECVKKYRLDFPEQAERDVRSFPMALSLSFVNGEGRKYFVGNNAGLTLDEDQEKIVSLVAEMMHTQNAYQEERYKQKEKPPQTSVRNARGKDIAVDTVIAGGEECTDVTDQEIIYSSPEPEGPSSSRKRPTLESVENATRRRVVRSDDWSPTTEFSLRDFEAREPNESVRVVKAVHRSPRRLKQRRRPERKSPPRYEQPVSNVMVEPTHNAGTNVDLPRGTSDQDDIAVVEVPTEQTFSCRYGSCGTEKLHLTGQQFAGAFEHLRMHLVRLALGCFLAERERNVVDLVEEITRILRSSEDMVNQLRGEQP